MRREGVVGFRGFGLDRYLTITSEGRETWAAGSLRGFVGWVGLARAGLAQAMESEETTDGHVSKFIALLRQRVGTSRDGRVRGLRERMCLELVKNDWGSRGLWLSDQSGQKISIELESLILAQNERWRQA
jgi:hypothetical protein